MSRVRQRAPAFHDSFLFLNFLLVNIFFLMFSRFTPINFKALGFLHFIPLLYGNMVTCFKFRVRRLKSQTCLTDVLNFNSSEFYNLFYQGSMAVPAMRIMFCCFIPQNFNKWKNSFLKYCLS